MSAEFGNMFVLTFMGKLLGSSGAKREASKFPTREFTPPGLLQSSPTTHRRKPLDLTEFSIRSPNARGQGGPFQGSRRFPDFYGHTILITPPGAGGGCCWSAQTAQGKT